jgi:hypothetical protein
MLRGPARAFMLDRSFEMAQSTEGETVHDPRNGAYWGRARRA